MDLRATRSWRDNNRVWAAANKRAHVQRATNVAGSVASDREDRREESRVGAVKVFESALADFSAHLKHPASWRKSSGSDKQVRRGLVPDTRGDNFGTGDVCRHVGYGSVGRVHASGGNNDGRVEDQTATARGNNTVGLEARLQRHLDVAKRGIGAVLNAEAPAVKNSVLRRLHARAARTRHRHVGSVYDTGNLHFRADIVRARARRNGKTVVAKIHLF